VLSGENVAFRDFEYIQATQRNRKAFLSLMASTFKNLLASREVYSLQDCAAFVSLLCPVSKWKEFLVKVLN
jgi:hypothetical protein